MRCLRLMMMFFGLALAAQAASAQQPLRSVAAQAGEPWTHRLTGMVLPPAAGGLTRGDIRDTTAEELDDAGIALLVGPALSLDALMGGGRSKSYSMTRLDRNGSSVLPSFNRLPPPQQALSVALRSSPVISTTTRIDPPQ